MREIKFRAWDTKHKAFTPFPFLVRHDGLVFEEYVGGGKPMKNFIVMQYTGLKDKNGKEIYEGDIVTGQYNHYDPSLDAYVDDEKMGGTVYWSYCGWSFKVIESLCDKDREGKINYFDFIDYRPFWAPQTFDSMEVIGNIYETPELLQG